MEAGKGNRVAIGVGLLFAALLASPGSSAAGLSDRLSLNGFYTLDATLDQGANVTLPTISSSAPVVLKDGKVNPGASLIGLQADYSLTDNLRFTVQAVSSKLTRNGYWPTLEWAYLSYDLDNDLYIRGGKFKLPLLQGTELRYVGFSRLWARPLVPNSGAGGFDNYHGAEIIKKGSFGDYNFTFQGVYGVADHQKDFIHDHNVSLLSTRIEKGQAWVNLALMDARYDVYVKNHPVLIQSNCDLRMASIETELPFGRNVVNAGYAFGKAEVSPDEQLAYLSLGRHYGRITPYLLYQYHRMKFKPTSVQLPQAGPPPPRTPPPLPLHDSREGQRTENSLSLGFRYDLDPTHDIKAQVERQFARDGSYPNLGPQRLSSTLFTIQFEGTF